MKLARKALTVMLAAGIAFGAVACGDDETDEAEPAVTAQPTQTETAGAGAETTPRPADTDTAPTAPDQPEPESESGGVAAPDGQSSPENQPGGAGDEVPASSQALITGRDGRLHPTVVRVPPFIAIRVELSSADGVEYELAGGGRDVKAGGEIQSASTTYAGLRPGKRLVLSGPQGKVTIEATAEPGP